MDNTDTRDALETQLKNLLIIRTWAAVAHGDQKWGGQPYVAHLDAVVEVLIRFGYSDPSLLAAAYLHDVLEDCNVTAEDILRELGPSGSTPVLSWGQQSRDFVPRAVELVKLVTNEPGKNRKERHIKTYPKIVSDPQSLVLKLADRIANLEQCWREQMAGRLQIVSKDGVAQLGVPESKLMGMYRKEWPDFYAALIVSPFAYDCMRMFDHLLFLLRKT